MKRLFFVAFMLGGLEFVLAEESGGFRRICRAWYRW